MKINKKCGWIRVVFNEGESDAAIIFTGYCEGKLCRATSLEFYGCFRDGPLAATICPTETGFAWAVDERGGEAESFDAAFENMPARLTNPDHYEDCVWSEQNAG